MGFFRRFFGLRKRAKYELQAKVQDNKSKRYSEASYVAYGNEVDPIYLDPLDCGLLPGEVVLLDWLDGKAEDRGFPDYFALLYGLNPEESVSKLSSRGLIRHSTPSEGLRSLKVEELKGILGAYGLSKSGKKDELIERIADSIPERDFSQHINSASYTLTEGGKVLLEELYYIPYAHKNRAELSSVAEVLRYLENRVSNIAGVDLGTEILLKRMQEAISTKNYFLLRNCFLNMGKINSSYEDHKSAITAYLCMFICEVSGWGNNGDYHENNIFSERSAIDASNSLKRSKIDMDHLRDEFDNAWASIESVFPKHYLGKEKTYECLVAGFNKDIKTIRRLLNLDNRKERDYSSYKF